MKYILKTLIYFSWLRFCCNTIDINSAELQYLADHLTPEECRRLVAAAHFQNFDEPNALDQAVFHKNFYFWPNKKTLSISKILKFLERKIPKDLSCIEHLHHWNSQPGEGKGQTHEILEHRLRQLGKIELADWLGKTVFHQLGVDLEKSIEKGLPELITEEQSSELPRITLEPLVPKIEDPTKYNMLDYLLYSLGVGLTLTIFGLCFKLAWDNVRERIKKRQLKKYKTYDFIETDSSGSEYEETQFDVRTFTSSSRITR